jgi:hypothetical protein
MGSTCIRQKNSVDYPCDPRMRKREERHRRRAPACQASEQVLYDSTRTVLCPPCLSCPMAPRLTLRRHGVTGPRNSASQRHELPSLDQQRIAKFCRSLSAKDRRKAWARTRRMRWLSHGATPQPDPLAWRGERGLDNQACPSQSTWRKRRQE